MWRTQYCQNDHTAKSSPQCDIQTIMLFTESENETHTQSDGKQRTRKPTQALQLAGTKVPRRVSPRGPGNTGYSVRRVTLSDLDNCTKTILNGWKTLMLAKNTDNGFKCRTTKHRKQSRTLKLTAIQERLQKTKILLHSKETVQS